MSALALIDGTNIVMRCASVMAAQQDLVCGTAFQIIQRFLEVAPVSHVVVAFDSGGTSFRQRLYPDYKANRKTKTDFWIAAGRHYFEGRGLVCVAAPGYEADDVIGAIAARIAPDHAHILSGDNDLLGLVSDRVHPWQFGHKGEARYVERTEAYVLAKYGLAQVSQIPVYKALVGEPGDNVKGVPRIGRVKARRLLQDYPTIEALAVSGELLDQIEHAKLVHTILQFADPAALPAFDLSATEVSRVR